MAAGDREDRWTLTEYISSKGEVRVLGPVLLCSTEVNLYPIPSFAIVQVATVEASQVPTYQESLSQSSDYSGCPD